MSDKKVGRYNNLLAEMVRKDISREQIAETIERSYNQTRLKINGKHPLTLEEAVTIQETHFPDIDLKHLFHR